MKKILTVQDISCLGKCSLTVALPLISAMGVETAILPTALLSTHTMFKDFTFKDLSSQIKPITDHWKKEGIVFDALYTGYLGTIDQIELVKDLFKDFKKRDNIIFVDPVMADNGQLYPGFNQEYVKKNTELCALADVIVPNITEACFLTHTEYKEEYDEKYIKELLIRLSYLGAKKSVITGVSLHQGMTGFMGYDRETKDYFWFENKYIDVSYHGTGDIFSSVSIGALMNGLSFYDAFKLASLYTAYTINETLKNPHKPWYGVDFETTIKELVMALEKARKDEKYELSYEV